MEPYLALATAAGVWLALVGIATWIGYRTFRARAAVLMFAMVLFNAIPTFGASEVRFDNDKFNFGPLILFYVTSGLLSGLLLSIPLGLLREARARKLGNTLSPEGVLSKIPAILLILFTLFWSREFIEKFFFADRY